MGEGKVSQKFDKGSIFLSVPMEGRGLDRYEYDLGFKRRELEGKTVLDLGSGIKEVLTQDLKEAKINATVISLSPDYSDQSIRGKVKAFEVDGPWVGLDWNGRSVAGVGQALPFKDQSFDVVLGEFSVTTYAGAEKDPEMALQWGKEIARVLKEGGVARLAPIGFGIETAYQTFQEELEKLGLVVRFEKLDRLSDYSDLKTTKMVCRLIIEKPKHTFALAKNGKKS